MIGENLKIFLIGLAGGIAGVVLIIGGFFGFFMLMDKLYTAKIDCFYQKEIEKGELKCEILEIKDRGNVLKTSEMISPPTSQEELKRIKDQKTKGKFIEVKFKVKNQGKETFGFFDLYFIDKKERRFPQSYNLIYWLPEEGSSQIFPGVEEEFIRIFEVPKDSELNRLNLKFSKPSRFLD